jgi:hypothetical protein
MRGVARPRRRQEDRSGRLCRIVGQPCPNLKATRRCAPRRARNLCRGPAGVPRRGPDQVKRASVDGQPRPSSSQEPTGHSDAPAEAPAIVNEPVRQALNVSTDNAQELTSRSVLCVLEIHSEWTASSVIVAVVPPSLCVQSSLEAPRVRPADEPSPPRPMGPAGRTRQPGWPLTTSGKMSDLDASRDTAGMPR